MTLAKLATMNFDFLELYKDHSNVQLLHILENPDGYQPSAVNAARELLAGRTVTDADLAAVNPPTSQTNVFEEESISDLIETLTNPSAFNSKWVLPFVVAVLAWVSYRTYSSFSAFWNQYQFGFAGYFMPATIIVTIAYDMSFSILLFKRKMLGWLLFAAQEMMVFTVYIGSTISYLSERNGHALSDTYLLGQLVIHGGFLLCLWSEPISATYKISPKIKVGYLIIGFLLALRAIYIGYTTANIHI